MWCRNIGMASNITNEYERIWWIRGLLKCVSKGDEGATFFGYFCAAMFGKRIRYYKTMLI